jgi:hypothetical protein
MILRLLVAVVLAMFKAFGWKLTFLRRGYGVKYTPVGQFGEELWLMYQERGKIPDLLFLIEGQSFSVFVPAGQIWNDATPLWAGDRKEEILSRIRTLTNDELGFIEVTDMKPFVPAHEDR